MSRRPRLMVWLGLTLAVGLGSRTLISPIPWWVKEIGDVLWAMAIYATLAAIWPAWRWSRLGTIAPLLAWASELTQLIRTPAMRSLRRLPVLGMLLGSGFSWIDMAMYAVGTAAAVAVDRWLIGASERSSQVTRVVRWAAVAGSRFYFSKTNRAHPPRDFT